jgi:hypothetical protein
VFYTRRVSADLDVVAEAQRLQPWWFRFEIGGHVFGGDAPRDVDKVGMFFDSIERCGVSVSTILELGSHEGNHSLQLADHRGVERVIALEGREENLQRARFVQRVAGATNIEFRLCNLERFNAAAFDPVDAVFCAGLFYHLPRPWLLIEQLAPIARFLFLDTHYALSEEVAQAGYCGRWYVDDETALGGLSPQSFWLSFKHLVLLLLEQGFVTRFVHDLADSPNGPRVWLFCEQTRGLGVVSQMLTSADDH